jgi:ABC-type transport system involved in multi-copper enzyme maturation permease subunit
MRKLRVLIGYELRQYFFSPFFYGICSLFLFLLGAIFFVALIVYADFRQDEPLPLQLFKALGLPLLIIVPILTTRAIASEKADRCFDSLLLLPVSHISIVLAKFFVIQLVYAGLWAVVTFFPEIAQQIVPSLAEFRDFTNFRGRFWGWCFVNLVGSVAIAFGLLASARAKTPATSMAMSVVGIFLFLVAGELFKHLLGVFPERFEIFSSIYNNWNVFFQVEDFCRGIFDTRVIVAYVSLTAALLHITAVTLREN